MPPPSRPRSATWSRARVEPTPTAVPVRQIRGLGVAFRLLNTPLWRTYNCASCTEHNFRHVRHFRIRSLRRIRGLGGQVLSVNRSKLEANLDPDMQSPVGPIIRCNARATATVLAVYPRWISTDCLSGAYGAFIKQVLRDGSRRGINPVGRKFDATEKVRKAPDCISPSAVRHCFVITPPADPH
jgi:hypothetical protein